MMYLSYALNMVNKDTFIHWKDGFGLMKAHLVKEGWMYFLGEGGRVIHASG